MDKQRGTKLTSASSLGLCCCPVPQTRRRARETLWLQISAERLKARLAHSSQKRRALQKVCITADGSDRARRAGMQQAVATVRCRALRERIGTHCPSVLKALPILAPSHWKTMRGSEG